MSARETLFLLPGLLCDAFTFERQAQALAPEYDVRRLDFFGLDSFAAMAAHVLAQAPPRFSLCGFSMGGRVALQILREAPERVARLVPAATPVSPARRPARPRPASPWWTSRRRRACRRFATRGCRRCCTPHGKATAPSSPRWRPWCCARRPPSTKGQIRALVGRADQTDLLPTLRLPTLVAVGRQDAWSPPAQHEAMAARIPGAQLRIFEDCGHFSPVEAPDVLTAALRALMDEPAAA